MKWMIVGFLCSLFSVIFAIVVVLMGWPRDWLWVSIGGVVIGAIFKVVAFWQNRPSKMLPKYPKF